MTNFNAGFFQQTKSWRTVAALMLATALLAGVAATGTAQAQTFTVLYDFGVSPGDPQNPYMGPLVQGRDGNLYSTSWSGGGFGAGSVFKITPTGTLTVVYSLVAGTTGYAPFDGLTMGTDGSFYGATITGGPGGWGTAFRVLPGGNLKVLYAFSNDENGSAPVAPPIQAPDGNLYGTTSGSYEGSQGLGTVYKITPSGQFTTIHQFSGTDGSWPYAPLIQATDGSFYGTTYAGCGIGFRITISAQFTRLAASPGCDPAAPLVQGSDGTFYGTTTLGGTYNNGAVFKMTPAGKTTVLHNFNSATDGAQPFAGLVEATDGNFYGVTWFGGPMGYGTIYRISPTGGFSVLHNFDGIAGQNPGVTLFQHTNGILYGETGYGGTYDFGTFYSLDLGLGPFVSLVSTIGKVGTPICILGQGFTGTTAVSFNGTAATFIVASDTYLTARVPSGAASGSVTVTTPTGTLTSNKKFIVK